MAYLLTAVTALCAAAVVGNIAIRRAGWLDRLVAYHKNRFIEDLKKLPPVNIKASIERAPPGYTDSQDWDYDSVVRLLSLIRDSDGAKTVRRALRRSMLSSRRFMTFAESLKAFPSLAKDDENDFYYDMDSGEYNADVDKKVNDTIVDDDDIIVVSNPVEARLPSASISVKLLKSILENRAKAGRYMSSTKKTIPWSPLSRRTTKKYTGNATTDIDDKTTTPSAGGATPDNNDVTTTTETTPSGNNGDTTTSGNNDNTTTPENTTPGDDSTTTPAP